MHKKGLGKVGLISTGIVSLSSLIFAPGTVVGVNLEIKRSIDIVVDSPVRLQVPKLSDLSKPLATRDGGFYCVGLSGDSAVLTRFDRDGNRISDLTVTNNRVDIRAPAIIADSFQEDYDGNLLYQLYGSGAGRMDTIFRVHTNGATQEPIASGISTHIFPTKNGYIVGLKTEANDGQPRFVWFDKAFAPKPVQAIRGPIGSWEKFSLGLARRFLFEEPDGSIIYAGTCAMRRLTKIRADGSLVWDRENKNNGTTTPSVGQDLVAVIRTADGGFLLGGTDTVDGPDPADYLLVKSDSRGEVEWTRRFGGSRVDTLQSVEPLENGGYLLCGNSDSEEASGSKGVNGKGVWIIQTDSRGLKQSETIVPYASWNAGLVRIPSGFAAIGFEGDQVVSAVHQIQLITTLRAHVSVRSEGGRPFSVDVSNDLTHWLPLVTRWTGDLELRETVSPNNRFWHAYEVP